MVIADQPNISDISFVGNENISTKELKKHLPLKKTGLFNQSIYNSRTVKLASFQLKHLYESNGYINAKIETNVEYDNDRDIILKFIINEGAQYHINGIEFYGNRVISNETLSDLLDVKELDVFNPIHVTHQLKKIYREYLKSGYYEISIVDDLQEFQNQVLIRINIAEGQIFHIGDINVNGLERLKEKVVLRETLIISGEPYNIENIEKTQTRIFSSLLFSSVEIYPIIRNDNSNIIDLDIKVKEMFDRGLKGEIGFGQTESPLGENSPPLTSIETNSMWRSGYLFNTSGKLTFDIDLGMTIDEKLKIMENTLFPQRSFSIGFRSPWVFGLRIPLNFRFYNSHVEKESNVRKQQGIESSFLYFGDEYHKLIGSVIFELVDAEGEDLVSSNELERKIKISYQQHNLQNLLTPKSGYFLGLFSTLRGTLLGGNTHFLKVDGEGKSYFNPFGNLILAMRVKAGYLYPFKQTNEIPSYEYFYLGGSTSLRGWDSPTEIDFSGNAEYRLLSNVELRFPIYGKVGGEFFFDGGQLGEKLSTFSEDKWYWNIGAGLTLTTPLGPARLDYGFPQAGQPYNVELSLLYSF